MSTGANCRVYEKTAGKWFYDLQCYPYGATEEYDTQGPFKTYIEASTHLHDNNANPGGCSIDALPGCPHDLLRKSPFAGPNETFTHYCNRCGGHVNKRTDAEKDKFKRDSLWARDSIQFPRLLAEIYAAGLSAKQEQDICKSMDISRDELYELLERADREFEKTKDQQVRKQGAR